MQGSREARGKQKPSAPRVFEYHVKHEDDEHLDYAPIEDYGIIGNLRTAALIQKNTSIDWFCFPDFDSPSVFGRILDMKKGGYFQIMPSIIKQTRVKQIYLPNTNVLVSRFLCDEGVSQVTDFMPLSKNVQVNNPWLVREVEMVRGYSDMLIECFPAFNYARTTHQLSIQEFPSAERKLTKEEGDCSSTLKGAPTKQCQREDAARTYFPLPTSPLMQGPNAKKQQTPKRVAVFETPELRFDFSVVMQTTEDGHPPPEIHWEVVKKHSLLGPGIRARVHLREAQKLYVIARFESKETNSLGCQLTVSQETCDELLLATMAYWRHWTSKCSYRGRWREQVLRSALVLKLMTFGPSGGIVASPSCSLPESFSGTRNWDYRYSWIRDSAFTLYAFMRIGFTEEADSYMKWIEDRCKELNPDGSLQIMYGVDGHHCLTEQVLDHLEGYRQSGPVRIGNHAYNQLQLDIYGELMDAVYLSNKYSAPISFDFWCHLRKLLNYVCANWQKPDYGIWEVRGGKRHFVYSKIMCWVALDRGARLADRRSFPSDRDVWIKVRDDIYENIMLDGWSAEIGAFRQYYGTDTLDAANLIMPLVFFMSPNDPRFLSTLDATMRSSEQGGLVANNLCFRYNVHTTDDGLTGEEGTFSICSFWLIEALSRAGRYDPKRLEQALLMFEQMVGYANHLGLYSEQIAKTGELLGNFPQAFTHLAVISAAFNLDRILG